MEVLPVPIPPSLVDKSITPWLDARRCELTNLVLSEKGYFLRVAASILRSEADAEDIIHTSFCSAWQAVAKFREDASMKTWFSRIVANHALDALRKMRRGRLVFIEDDPGCLQCFERDFSSVVEDPEKITIRQESLRLVNKYIQRLPAETRIVFVLHFSDDCSIERIAELRGKSRLAVSSHLQRGKALLRRSVRKTPARRIVVQR